MNLTPSQLEKIALHVSQKRVHDQRLREELVDHLICAVEYRMANGYDFERALAMGLEEIAPAGFKDIQDEHTITLIPQSEQIMKRFLYIAGCLSAMTIVTAIVFEVFKLPGAGFLIVGGVLGFIFVILPLVTTHLYEKETMKRGLVRAQYISGYIGTAVGLVGVGFKLLHLPGAMLILGIALIIYFLIFLPIVIRRLQMKYKGESLGRWSYMVGYVALGASFAAFIFKMLHLPGSGILIAVAAIVVNFLLLPILFYRFYRSSLLGNQ